MQKFIYFIDNGSYDPATIVAFEAPSKKWMEDNMMKPRPDTSPYSMVLDFGGHKHNWYPSIMDDIYTLEEFWQVMR